MKQFTQKLVIYSLISSSILGISMILLGIGGVVLFKILGTTFALFIYGLLALSNSNLYDDNESVLASLGLLFSFISCSVCILFIWGIINFFDFDEFTLYLLYTVNFLSFSSSHIACICQIKPCTESIKSSKDILLLLIFSIDLLVICFIWEFLEMQDFIFRLYLVLAILVSLGTVLLPIINRINKNNTTDNIQKFNNDSNNTVQPQINTPSLENSNNTSNVLGTLNVQPNIPYNQNNVIQDNITNNNIDSINFSSIPYANLSQNTNVTPSLIQDNTQSELNNQTNNTVVNVTSLNNTDKQ